MLLLAGPTNAQTVIKIATIAPEGSSWMKEMRAGGKEISKRTEGRVQVKFYGGGVMGNDQKVQRKMRIGQLHGGAFTSGALAERYGNIQIYSLPLLFRNFAEVDYVRERMDAKLAMGLADAGLVTFGFSEGGFAFFMANEPLRVLDDLKNRKVWVPEGDQISYAAMKKFGLTPVTLPLTDVMTGLQTGLIDVVASSPVGALALQWHTKIKYVTEIPLTYIVAMLAIEKRVFEKLRREDQAVFREVMERVYTKFNASNRVSNEQAARAMMANQITFVQASDGEFERWTPGAKELYGEIVGADFISHEILSEVQAYLDHYRSYVAPKLGEQVVAEQLQKQSADQPIPAVATTP
ncbi:MAG: TRAP transporter substrate-binding protein DctP [Gammaproteobacteria bacterium]|nr:TRAP transporter substrate-binding protein DctP [Gammaproteobacteria bacterium]